MNPFDFSKDYFLENEQVLLRPIIREDYDNLAHFTIEEPELWKYSIAPIINGDGLKEYISFAIKARDAEKEYPFIVYDKKIRIGIIWIIPEIKR